VGYCVVTIGVGVILVVMEGESVAVDARDDTTGVVDTVNVNDGVIDTVEGPDVAGGLVVIVGDDEIVIGVRELLGDIVAVILLLINAVTDLITEYVPTEGDEIVESDAIKLGDP